MSPHRTVCPQNTRFHAQSLASECNSKRVDILKQVHEVTHFLPNDPQCISFTGMVNPTVLGLHPDHPRKRVPRSGGGAPPPSGPRTTNGWHSNGANGQCRPCYCFTSVLSNFLGRRVFAPWRVNFCLDFLNPPGGFHQPSGGLRPSKNLASQYPWVPVPSPPFRAGQPIALYGQVDEGRAFLLSQTGG